MENSQDFRERTLDVLECLEHQQRDQNNDIKELRKDISDLRVSQARVEQKLDDTLTQRRGRWANAGIVAAVVGTIVSLIKSFFFNN